MANTAEELGRRYGITREQADRFAHRRSQTNAKKAREAGWVDEEVSRHGRARRGDPLGATGAVLTLTCAYALRRAGRDTTS